MKISPQWVRDFVDLKLDNRQLAEELTLHGIAVEGMEHDGADMVYEVEFTSNRPDAMNHYGVARECSAIFDVDLKPVAVKLPPAAPAPVPFAILIEDAAGCARYTGRVVRGVTIGASPEQVIGRLQSVEQRSISNVADATNYALWELGHPTHAFDLDLLEGGKIIVRRAREGETLTTLDGVERKLSKEDLVIADACKPVALAGVMGGADTAISEKTRNVLIEAAWFDPAAIRKTAKRHGMHTDASHRFERGADFSATPLACARVAQLILDSAGGQLEGDEIDVVARTIKRPMVDLRRREIVRILGQEIPEDEVVRMLERLGFLVNSGKSGTTRSRHPERSEGPAVSSASPGKQVLRLPLRFAQDDNTKAEAQWSLAVQPPAWRLDVDREIDCIEEIARIRGYNRFPNTLPEFTGAVIELPDEQKDAKVRRTLLALGYHESMSWTFLGRGDAEQFASGEVLELANPISDEAAVMRPSLLSGMLAMLAWNLNRGNSDVRLFEAGHVFERIGDKAGEHERLSLGATGNAVPPDWETKPRPYTFFDLKGDIDAVLHAFEHRSLYYDEHAPEYLHPGRAARAVMDGATVARFGQLHPEIAAARKLKQDIYVGEIYLDRLYQHALRAPRYTPIPRFPAVERDFSLLFGNAVGFERIREAVESLRLAELRSFAPVEIFRGGGVPEGKYSVLLRAMFQSPERTLRDEEVAQWAQRIVHKLESLGGTLRA